MSEPTPPTSVGPIYNSASLSDSVFTKTDVSNFHLADINQQIQYQTSKLDLSIDILDSDVKTQTQEHGQKLDGIDMKLQSVDTHVQSSAQSITDKLQTVQGALDGSLFGINSSGQSGTSSLSAKFDDLKAIEETSRNYLSGILSGLEPKATEEKQDAEIAALDSIDAHIQSGNEAIAAKIDSVNTTLSENFYEVRQSVETSSAALGVKLDDLKSVDESARDYLMSIESKVATEQKQDSANASLASIDSKLTSPIVVTSAQTLSFFHNSSASTNAFSIKPSPTRVYSFVCSNMSSGMDSVRRYVKLFNTNTEPMLGSSTPVIVIPIEPGASERCSFDAGQYFDQGLACAITAGAADNNAVAVNAGEIKVAISYQ